MTISSVLSSLPSNIAMYVLSALLVSFRRVGLVRSLRTKGDVRAVLSRHGKNRVIETGGKREKSLASTPNAPRLP